MLDPDPVPHNMDPPPKPTSDFVQPKKSTKGNVSVKSRNIKKNAKKNSSKGSVFAKGVDEMDVGNEACGNMEESEEGIGEGLGLHSKAQEDPQKGNNGSNSVGMVVTEEPIEVMNGSDGNKSAGLGNMESSPTMVSSVGKVLNDNVSDINVEMSTLGHLDNNSNVDFGNNGGNCADKQGLNGSVNGEGQASSENKVPVTANANESVRSTKSFSNVLQGMAENNSNKLRLIASRIGTPIIMDMITSSMCEKEFGRANFARVLVEVDAAKGLQGCVEVCYKSLGRSMCLDVEYAWTPPLCSHCKRNSGDVKGNKEWRNVSYKKVVKNGAESSHVNDTQFANRSTYFTRSNAARGRGGFSGRDGYKNVQQGESSRPVDTQKTSMLNKGSSEEVGFESVPKKNKANNKVNEKQKNVGKQEILTKNRYSSLIDADEDVNMIDGQDIGDKTSSGLKSY
ncbi:zinc knuckle CX2CX4HX4C [Artemisia annua]|uniref:Zinc knuckle CX2CX4HX4C n=1 Tax=Artemisia annua TaxID=35608 RepID=A0A2U1PSE0_ARTAN|nr:zinc knuckle CX2CX4HX4C [Artemisia annua]